MSPLVICFLEALYRLLHESCIAEFGAFPNPIRIVYGGNCWDAVQVARSIGGWVSWQP